MWLREAGAGDAVLDAEARDAGVVLGMLDAAGARSALVLSQGYQLASGGWELPVEHERVRHENDWVAAQAAGSGGRLVAFCSVDPWRPYAEEEVRRCAGLPGIRGLKLHLTPDDPGTEPPDLGVVAPLVRAAAESGLALLVHYRAREAGYGAGDMAFFLDSILPLAGGAPVQLAHLGGWGGFDRETASALDAVIGAVEERRPGTERLFLDLAFVLIDASDAGTAGGVAGRLDRLRGHVVFGSDWPLYETAAYREVAAALLAPYPGIMESVDSVVPPYLR